MPPRWVGDPVAIVGAGPAGLMAADVISAGGIPVVVYDAMPSAGRKFLRAGIGGLNLTHAEPLADFVERYGDRRDAVAGWMDAFGPDAVRSWARDLGIALFVGSSRRVFPRGMKASPLLRAWLLRLRSRGVGFSFRHYWQGWSDDGLLAFATPTGPRKVGADGTVLALGGGSWARLGSDGAWVTRLAARGVGVAPLRPANCGFDVPWSEHLRSRYAGTPVKAVAASCAGMRRSGEFVISRHGVEGGLVYALASPLRDTIERDGHAILAIDLAPGRELPQLAAALQRPQGRDSLANHLRRNARIEGVKAALLREFATPAQLADPLALAGLIKALPITLTAPRPIDEAISTAGGICLGELDDRLMLTRLPGVFCAGEMLDWEAPTGGYLLTACLASGHLAGHGMLRWRQRQHVADNPVPAGPAAM